MQAQAKLAENLHIKEIAKMWEGVPRTKISEYFSFRWMYVSCQCYQCSWKQMTFLAWFVIFQSNCWSQKMININSCVKVKDPGLLSSGYLWGPLLSVQWPWPIAPVHTAHTNKKSWWIRMAVSNQGRLCRPKKHIHILHHSLKNREVSSDLQIPPTEREEYCIHERVSALPLNRTFPQV